MTPSHTPGPAAIHRGPRGHALVGNLRDFSRDQLGFYVRCAREYGDVVPVRLGPFPGLLIYHPDAIEEVLVVRNRDFIKSRGVRLMRGFLGDGLFTAEGDLWLRQRRLMQPAFHRQHVAAYGETMLAYAARRAADWQDSERDMREKSQNLQEGGDPGGCSEGWNTSLTFSIEGVALAA